MDKQTFWSGVLVVTAAVLAVGLLVKPVPEASARAAITTDDYSLVTATNEQGGETLFITDTRAGVTIAFEYNPNARRIEPAAFLPTASAFTK